MSADRRLRHAGGPLRPERSAAPTRRAPTATGAASALCTAVAWRAKAAAQPARPDMPAQPDHALAELEVRHGGRLGVVARGTVSGRKIACRAEERFAMCSTHKVLTAAAILTMVDRGHMQLARRIPYRHADLLAYAPVTRRYVNTGWMTVDALCAAALQWSDNTAENLLLGLIGGPAGWTRYARSIGDTLLRAGLPTGWQVGDKSGSGDYGSRNDIGVLVSPRSAPILASAYYTGSGQPSSSRDHVITHVGRIIAATFASRKEHGA